MSNFYYNSAHTSASSSYPSYHSTMPNHNHHGGRSRRAGRFSNNNQHSHRHRQNNRHPKEAADAAFALAHRVAFEAARSFDLEDDEMFCPWHLLTEDDLHSIHSSSSDRSSLSSGSPDSSPLQQQLQPTPNFTPHSAASFHLQQQPSLQYQQATAAAQLQMHQPLPKRTINPIPIVDPSTRTAASPPPSTASPARSSQKPFSATHWP